MNDKEWLVSIFVANILHVPYDCEGNFTFEGPDQFGDFNNLRSNIWALVEHK